MLCYFRINESFLKYGYFFFYTIDTFLCERNNQVPSVPFINHFGTIKVFTFVSILLSQFLNIETFVLLNYRNL